MRQYSHIRANVVGYVLDSCPYHFGYLSTYRAQFSGFPFFKRMGLMFLFTIKMALQRLVALIPFTTYFWPYLTFSSARAYRETLYRRYIGTLAQLYVWSTNDKICSPNYIADFVNRRQAEISASDPDNNNLGSTIINTFVVNDAPHVHTLRMHPQEYSQQIDAFIARITPSTQPPPAKM